MKRRIETGPGIPLASATDVLRRARLAPPFALWLGIVLACAGVLAAQAPPEPALGEVETLIGRGQFVAAVEALRSLPRPSARSDYLLGFSLIQLYRYGEAEKALRRAVARQPREHVWLQALAKALLEQGKNLAAIEFLDRAIALEPDPQYLFAKAMCALNAGDLDTAEAALARCLETDPDHAEALYKSGQIEIDRGNYLAAKAPLRRCLELRPDHLEARFLFGLAASRSGEPVAARAAFEAVIAKVPGHVGALYNLGRVLMQEGRRDEGKARLEEFRAMSRLKDEIDFLAWSVKKNPRNVDLRLRLAPLLLEAGRTEDALRELQAARQLEPRRAETYRLVATALRRLGREGDAAQAEAFAARLGGPGG